MSSSPRSAAAPTYGDVHHTPFYDTSYQHFHGYNERNQAAKALHWSQSYSLHAPSASRLREAGLTRPGRSEQAPTQTQDAQVAQVLLHRQGALGSSADLATKNSARVAGRHGESQRVGSSTLSQTASLPRWDAHEQWSLSTLPGARTSSMRPGGSSGSSSSRASVGAGGSVGGAARRHGRGGDGASRQWNSRQGSYESEYVSGYCPPPNRGGNSWPTKREDFFSRSAEMFSDPEAEENRLDSHVVRKSRPLSPSLSLGERAAHERLSAPALEGMRRPVHRKLYPHQAEYPASQRPEPYSFDLRAHIAAVRPSPLFTDRAAGEWVSPARTGSGKAFAATASAGQPQNGTHAQFNSRGF